MIHVGLSNILDRELSGRKPAKRSHGKVAGVAVEDSEQFCKVVQRVKAVAGIKSFLVFPVAAFHLAVVAGRIGTNQLVPDTQLHGCGFKQGGQVSYAVGEAIGKLKAVVCLDARHPNPPAGIPLEQLFQEAGGGAGALLGVSSQETQACKLVNTGVQIGRAQSELQSLAC